MSIVSRSFYAARGNLALRGMNSELEGLALTKEDFAGMKGSKQNDGVWLTFLYRQNKRLRMEGSSIANGAWFHENTTPASIDLVFNVPVSTNSIVTGAFKWITASTTANVNPLTITKSELGKKLTVPVPSLVDYVGPVSLVVDLLTSDDGDLMEAPIGIGFQVTESSIPLPRSGDMVPSTKSLLRGLMTVGRVVSTRGMSVDLMMRNYLRTQDLEGTDLLEVVQVPGSNSTVELFILAWKSRAPAISAVTPPPNSTMPQESAPTQILLTFDQDVSAHHLKGLDGVDRVFYNGTPVTDLTGVTIEAVDSRGRQWLVKSNDLFSVVGNHVLAVRDIPDKFGDRPGGSYLVPWQVLPLSEINPGTAYCQDFVGDGVQTIFALTAAPFPCTLQVFLEGVFRHPDCYVVTGTTLTFGVPPHDGANVRFMYRG